MPGSRANLIMHSFFWLAIYTAFWLLLAGTEGWYIGIPAVLAATWLSRQLHLRPWLFRLQHLPTFLWLFFAELCTGGWDVARRALHPRLPLDPAWVHYPLTCKQPRVRLMLSATVGMMPGTLATVIEGDCLTLHVLDQHQPWHTNIARLERELDNLMGDGTT
ncbi:MAG TPA: sodium:proton antiporter [Pseudomonas xinjiangensis]|uniref:Sodium:proton antiporter n=2 Tax=root TaxID=1 RepID=A0A7V1BPB2_9GAMM|nr:sodium:proton antiporter [Halopseudomonas xinjiangensis]HEC48143.1 sodium:proton antiporter [Halopseudomonas xinjiangensis]